MTVPHELKRPGLIAVAPKKTAAYAGNRYASPEPGVAELVVPTYRTPAKALTTPEITNAEAREDPTPTPLSLATSRPRPTYSSRRPKLVYSRMYHATMTRIRP